MRASDLVRRTLEVLRREANAHYAMLVAELVAMSLTVEIDEERIAPSIADGAIVLSDLAGRVRVRISLCTLLDLVEGRESLLGALRARRLVVVGDRTEIPRLERALRVYVHGLVRCTSAPSLLSELQEMTGGASYGD